MKEKTNEKEKFFSKISHDLRGSFTSILGFSDILNDPNEELSLEEIKEFSTRIGLQSKETFDLLVNFINWLKLENYSYGLTNENLELYDALLETKNDFKKRFEEKKIQINFNLVENATVFMDYEILNSINNNLFTFLLKVCSTNSIITVNHAKAKSNKLKLEITAKCDLKNMSFLQNINLQDLNSELSLPIVFAIKFIELSGGEFDFKNTENNSLIITVILPIKQ